MFDEMMAHLKEEESNTKYEKEIVCPYCNTEQDNETMYNHVSYWGDDSKTKIECEHCGKEFWVEECVQRNFKTSTIEWDKKEEERWNKLTEELQ